MINFKLYFLIFILIINLTKAEISDKRYCVDEQCTVPISRAKTLLRYSSPDPKILSFGQNEEILIYSKSAGKKANLWGAEINGKRGYVPHHLVREYKVLRKATLLVDTEIVDNKTNNSSETVVPPASPQVPVENHEKHVEPDKVKDAYEVVDGTTIYQNPQEIITPSSTEDSIQPTVMPEIAQNNEQANENVEKSGGDTAGTLFGDVLTTLSNAVIGNDDEKQNNDEVEIEDEYEDDSEDDNDAEEDEDGDEDEEIQNTKTANIEIDKNQVVENTAEEKIKSESEKLKITTLNAKLDETLQENLELIKNDIANNQTQPVSDVVANDQVVETKLEENVVDKKLEGPLPIPELKTSPDKATTDETLQENLDSNQNDLSNNNQNQPPSNKDDIVAETNKVVDSKIDETPLELKTPPFETETTIEPELEIPPQPIEPIIETITPNPVLNSGNDQIKSETISDSPLGGLFGKKLDLDESVKTEEQINSDSLINEQQEIDSKSNLENVEIQQQISSDFTFSEESLNVTTEQLQSNQNKEDEVKDVENSERNQNIEENTKQDTVEATENNQNIDEKHDEIVEEQPGMLSNMLSFFGGSSNVEDGKKEEIDDSSTNYGVIDDKNLVSGINSGEDVVTTTEIVEEEKVGKVQVVVEEEEKKVDKIVEDIVGGASDEYCTIDSCQTMENQQKTTSILNYIELDWTKLNTNILIYLSTTALSVLILIIAYIAIEKNRREGPLVAKINQLEKDYLIILKENELLKDGSNQSDIDNKLSINDHIKDELNEKNQQIDELLNLKQTLEEQIQSLEKELENSTEVGLELNRMLSEILNSQSGSDVIRANIDHLQKQLIEQQATINSVNETLALTNTENHELKLEIELNNKKIIDLQSELDKMCLNILKIEEEKETQQNLLENDVIKYRQLYEDLNNQNKIKENELNCKIELLENQLQQIKHDYELKQKEFNILKDNVKLINNNEITLTTLIETTEIKAEFELLKVENQRLNEKLTQLQNDKNNYEKQLQTTLEEIQRLQNKYDEADKLKVEAQTKLEVLSNYFKEKEAQLQKEISKHESLWAEKEGEATSTTERIKFMQEQLQNYKAQNESLKQEIISQEVELKSQISVLEKKAHENWMTARQIERKLEDAKQETAQLRHRLTLSERALQEEKTQRLQSPIEQNGDLSIESPSSPPLLYGRDHITKSPPLPPPPPGLPPFLPPPPPPPGVPPFIPPPPNSSGLHGIPPPPFMPPPNLYPGDHRPPPLGRMSSPPPLNSRYSPSSRGYSPYDRDHSSSPSDSEYGTSPPRHHQHHRRGYSPFNDRRDYKRPQPIRKNGRNVKGGSSGSGHSNESLDKINRHQPKV